MSSPDIQSPEERANFLRVRFAQERAVKHPPSDEISSASVSEGVTEEEVLSRLNFTALEDTPLAELMLSTRIVNTFLRLANPRSRASRHIKAPLPHIVNAGTLSMYSEEELTTPRAIGSGSIQDIRERLGQLGLALANPHS